MARKKSKFVEEVEDINLIPIMNLVLCLIPLVLFKDAVSENRYGERECAKGWACEH